MSAFGGLFLTDAGRLLLSKAQIGKTINFKRISIGDGETSGSFSELTAVKNEKLSCNITRKDISSQTNVKLRFHISNDQLEDGFYFREIGVIAEDPDTKEEVLYCYGNAGDKAEYIPKGGSADIIEKNVDIIVIVENASTVTATIDDSLSFVTQKEFAETISQINDEIQEIKNSIKTLELNQLEYEVIEDFTLEQ